MSKDHAPTKKSTKSVEETPVKLKRHKKEWESSELEKETIMAIAKKAKKLREDSKMSYEDFALEAGINRNSYYRFEKASFTGKNFTIGLLLKIIGALNLTPEEFFKDIS